MPNYRKIDRDLVDRLSRTWEPIMRRAFLDAVSQIVTAADVTAIAAALARGDINAAFALVDIDPRDFIALPRTIAQSFDAGGTTTAAAITARSPRRLRLTVRFDPGDNAAAEWVRDRSSNLVTEIVTDQRTMIRQAMQDGVARGQAPRQIANDLVGRINRVTGKREGGKIGLTSRMERASARYAADIRSGDPERIRRATTLTLRDRRFDRTVAKALRDEEPIPSKLADKMARQYNNKALKSRGNTIARTEMLESLHESNRQSFQQAINDGSIAESGVLRFAHTAGDERVRHSHALIPGMNRDGVAMNEAFLTPDGPMMNAPFGINCRCTVEHRVDFLAGITG